MAGFLGTATTTKILCSGNTNKTMIQGYVGPNHYAKFTAWGVYLDGVNFTGVPIQFSLLSQGTTGIISNLTPQKIGGLPGTLQTTFYHTATTEPTTLATIKRILVHPQAGYEEQCPFGQEYLIGNSGHLGIVCENNSSSNVSGVAWFRFEE